MENKIHKYTTYLRLEQDGDDLYYVAEHREIEGCFSTGETAEEALQNLSEVTTMILEHLRQHNLPVPEPQAILVPAEITVSPRSLRDVLADIQPRLEIMSLVPA